jgi:endonuclease YncB( thermonuclease family)
MLASIVFSAVVGTLAGTASVIDADTLEIRGERIRLVGVDAPESGQKCLDTSNKFVRCGTTAANALDKWINRASVSCDIEGKDRYGRLLGQCKVRGQNSTAYVPAELKARGARAGIWAGEFVMPWDWRQGLRLEGEKPTKAMISGKFASNGGR